ncbi:MAG: methyltransferase domain-containing protein [Candidatus Lokiarchaeia archaeon]
MKSTEEFKKNQKNKIDGISFSFGKNWKKYLNSLTIEKIQIAKQSLKDFLGNIKGKTCVDIGSGSGLFSYSMYTLGAKEVTSIDIDLFSVQCANYLKSKVKSPERWNIYQGSILDKKFVSQFSKYDIVYSWGVLHHTGNMWEAIKNAASLVNDNGIFFLAIYNKTRSSRFWLKVKKIYNLSPKIGKKLMNFLLFSVMYFILPLLSLKNPLIKLKNYKKNRGMDPMTDVRDWLGGYPFEVATFKEIVTFLNRIDQNFKLIKYNKVNPNVNANNELVFKNVK